MGEVVLASDQWDYVDRALPRDPFLWHPQYAESAEQRQALARLPQRDRYILDRVNLAELGATTVLRPHFDAQGNNVGHWRRSGFAITLGDLLYRFGDNISSVGSHALVLPRAQTCPEAGSPLG